MPWLWDRSACPMPICNMVIVHSSGVTLIPYSQCHSVPISVTLTPYTIISVTLSLYNRSSESVLISLEICFRLRVNKNYEGGTPKLFSKAGGFTSPYPRN